MYAQILHWSAQKASVWPLVTIVPNAGLVVLAAPRTKLIPNVVLMEKPTYRPDVVTIVSVSR